MEYLLPLLNDIIFKIKKINPVLETNENIVVSTLTVHYKLESSNEYAL